VTSCPPHPTQRLVCTHALSMDPYFLLCGNFRHLWQTQLFNGKCCILRRTYVINVISHGVRVHGSHQTSLCEQTLWGRILGKNQLSMRKASNVGSARGNTTLEKTCDAYIYIYKENFTFIGPCIMIYSYNKSQRDALFLKFIFVKNSICFGQIYCPSSGVSTLYTQQ